MFSLPPGLLLLLMQERGKLKVGLQRGIHTDIFFRNPQIPQMANNAKFKKWLQGKDKIEGTFRETWSKDEIEDITLKVF